MDSMIVLQISHILEENKLHHRLILHEDEQGLIPPFIPNILVSLFNSMVNFLDLYSKEHGINTISSETEEINRASGGEIEITVLFNKNPELNSAPEVRIHASIPKGKAKQCKHITTIAESLKEIIMRQYGDGNPQLSIH